MVCFVDRDECRVGSGLVLWLALNQEFHDFLLFKHFPGDLTSFDVADSVPKLSRKDRLENEKQGLSEWSQESPFYWELNISII